MSKLNLQTFVDARIREIIKDKLTADDVEKQVAIGHACKDLGKRTKAYARAYMLACHHGFTRSQVTDIVQRVTGSKNYSWGKLKTDIASAINGTGEFSEKLTQKDSVFGELFGKLVNDSKQGPSGKTVSFADDVADEESPLEEVQKWKLDFYGGDKYDRSPEPTSFADDAETEDSETDTE